MNRFFVDRGAILDNTIEITDGNDLNHINKVLRLKPGDRLEISDSKEFEYETEIINIDRDVVVLKILDKQKFAKEPQIRVTLYQGVPKSSKMDSIIQKSVELGVHAIVPVFTKRTVVTENRGFEKKLLRWNRISQEAVKQCKRGIIPKVENSMGFFEMENRFKNDYDLILFPYEDELETTIKDVMRGLDKAVQNVALIIGPEGGFSEREAAVITSAGGYSVTLGKTILRTETAGPTALAMIMYELEL